MTLINGDKEEHVNAPIILAFCKFCGEDYAGLVSMKLRQEAARFDMKIPTSDWLPPDKQQNVKNLLKDYYSSLCKHLLQVIHSNSTDNSFHKWLIEQSIGY